MRKNLFKIVATIGVALGGILTVAPDVMAVRLEERVRIIPNEVDDIMITRIAPYDKKIDLEYHAINPAYPEEPNRTAFRINIGYGNFSDMDIYSLNDYKSVSAQGFPEEVGAVKVTSMMVDSVKANWSDGQTLNLYGFMVNSNADLVDGSGGRLIYRILFTYGEVLLGRVDYTRCINSSVFRSGEATECRLEYLENSKVQYQPYTSEGVRVEIPLEEDVLLKAATEAWEPEYGWPDLPPEPEPVESEPVEPEPVISEPESVEPVVEPEPVVVNPEPEVEGLVVESVAESERKNDIGAVLTGVKTEGMGSVKIENDKSSEEEIIMTEVTGEASRTSGVNGTDGTGVETIKSGDSLNYEVADTGGVEAMDIGANIASEETSRTEVAVTEENKQDDMEVPDLGQETGKKPNIALAIIAVIGVGVIMVWWFLFFGKRKNNERKEGKE